MGQHKLAKPLIHVGHGSGQPAGMPDFVPLNPWGRPMPKPIRPDRPKLYQVVVRDMERGGVETRIGPRMDQRDLLEKFCLDIAQAIHSGAEKRWKNPVVVDVG